MNITKYSFIKNKLVVTSREREGEGTDKDGDQEVQTTMHKIYKQQGCIIQHKEYSQYFTVTINGI